jgi:hypothetical protein
MRVSVTQVSMGHRDDSMSGRGAMTATFQLVINVRLSIRMTDLCLCTDGRLAEIRSVHQPHPGPLLCAPRWQLADGRRTSSAISPAGASTGRPRSPFTPTRRGPDQSATRRPKGRTQPIGAGFWFGVLRADCDCLQSRGTMLNDPRLGALQCRPRGFAQHGRRLEHLHGGRHRNLPRLRAARPSPHRVQTRRADRPRHVAVRRRTLGRERRWHPERCAPGVGAQRPAPSHPPPPAVWPAKCGAR